MAEEWRRLDAVRHKPDAQAHWDKRARTYSFHDAPNDYVRSFIAKMGLVGGESVLDMGCGTGSLAIPLAKLGHRVVAADFSEGMLERVRENASAAGVPLGEWNPGRVGAVEQAIPGASGLVQEATACVHGASGCAQNGLALGCEEPTEPTANGGSDSTTGVVFPLRMSWEDDWARFGLGADSVDIALASRSIITHDLEDSIRKLSTAARKRVCVTAGTGVSPRVDERVATAMGLALERHNDALFVFGIASDLGFEPTVSYIHSPRMKTYASPDEAYHSLLKTMEYVGDAAQQVSAEQAAARLKDWLASHLVEAATPEGGKCWHLDKPRDVPWAFISWDV